VACLSFRTPIFSLVASFCLVGAALVFSAGPAAAATCPTVDPGTGAVSPAPIPGVQWPGCDLSGADLVGGDMAGGNLFGANFTNANLTGANLTGTGLTSADLTNANLTNAHLMQAMLSGTIMTGATLTGVSSGLISGTPASLPTGWILANKYLVGPGANLQFAGLGGSDLTNADLSNADLTNGKLAQVTLTGATLTGATLKGVTSGGIVGTPASLPQDWSVKAGYLLGPGADISMAGLGNVDLSGLNLTGILLDTVDLTGANLSNTNLSDAILNEVKLNGTSLMGATLTGEQSTALSGTPASLPAGWSISGGHLIGPGADLHGVDLHSLDLSGADLSAADLSAANLIAANLTGANLTSANLTGAMVSGKANLTGANLSNANLTSVLFSGSNLMNAKLAGANLTDSGLSDANLAGADLTGATLTGAAGVGIKGTPSAMPTNWSIRGGYLIGPGTGTVLTDASLSSLDLTGVNFSGLNLLRAAFRHANLTHANLTKANLTGADFSYANLTRADLFGARVSSTTFAATIWSNTTCPDGSNSDTHAHGWCFPPPPSSGFTAHKLPLPPAAISFTPLTISCASSTQCFGGGTYDDPALGFLPALLRWNGTQWSVSATSLPADHAAIGSPSSAAITSMSCPSLSRCYAGGSYRTRLGSNQGMLFKWAASRWSVAKAPLPANASPNPDATVAGMSCLSVTFCFAVGQYSTATGDIGLLLRWSGTKWSPRAAPLPAGSQSVASLNAVSCPSVTLCFAGGLHYDAAAHSQLLMLKWSGGTWTVVKVSLPVGAAANPQAAIGGLSCPSTTQCVAVGSYVDSNGNQQGLLLTRSGTSWTAAKAPVPAGAGSNPWVSVNTVSCPATSRCTAGGGYVNTASQSVGLLLFWSGKAWKAVPAPAGAYMLHGMSCPTLTRCVAVSSGPVALTGP
jgi:uncharacterized protein YjbI with pentapeptide repeats